MSKDPFAAALRAELDAVVARYEALARAHHEALIAAREQEVTKLRQDLATMLADRERSRAQEAELRAQLKAQADRASAFERDLAQASKQLDAARAAASEARNRHEAQLADAARRLEAAEAQGRAAVEREQKAAAELRAQLKAQLDEAHRQLDAARAEAHQKLAQVEGALREVKQEAESLSEAFSAERSFVEATASLDGSPLLDALRGALGADLSPSPATYAAIKARRPDAVLALAFKERGRTALTQPLSDRERAALPRLASASGCELIEPEHGARFSASSMDKASTQPDPAEEGNVLDCLFPGLRLAGTDGALVFPRVVVATG